jgi:subtilisin family serine protease
MIICFAAGNESQDANGNGIVDPMSVTPPGTAKNCITVGATENDRPTITDTYGSWWPSDFSANPIASDRMADNPGGMAGFSGRGPTKDKRFKPDLVAPGTFILSTKSRDVSPSNNAWASSADPLYFYMGGTSMATPLVAGCVALVREFLAKRPAGPIANPSAALVKALLINGAVDIPGQYLPTEAGAVPNSNEGFGRVDMNATIGAGATQLSVIRDEGQALDQGEEVSMSVTVPPGATLLKATLVWTDPAGEALQNDLDLVVKAGNLERHGNMPLGSTVFDRINNVEQVVWTGIPAGTAEVVVSAFRITQASQSFALVVRVA